VVGVSDKSLDTLAGAILRDAGGNRHGEFPAIRLELPASNEG